MTLLEWKASASLLTAETYQYDKVLYSCPNTAIPGSVSQKLHFHSLYITPFANLFNDYVSVHICGVQPFLTANHSDTSDLAKFHERFLKHITVFSDFILCVTGGSMGHLRNSQSHKWPTGHLTHTTGLRNNL